MEEELLKCFICQSKSKSQSADESSQGKRTRKDTIYNNLDPSTWKVFCHYFYPTSVDYLTSLNNNNNTDENFSPIPVFCGACCQTILNLCNLHSQLELIQSQISKIVVQVSVAFVQENESHDHDNENEEESTKYDRQQKLQDKEQQQQQCDDVIYSMRQCIRQRLQPSVCLTRTNIDQVPNQNDGGSSISNNLRVEQPSALSIHSDDLNLDYNVNHSQPSKQEDVDSINELLIKKVTIINNEYLDNQENLNEDKNLVNNLDLPALDTIEIEVQSENKMNNCESANANMPNNIEDEDSCHGNQDHAQDSEIDQDYQPVNDSDNNNAVEKQVSIISKSITKKVTKTKGRRMGAPLKDKEVGDNIYEYKGKWRYERKKDERDGHFKSFCLSCPMGRVRAFRNRGVLIKHIEKRHIRANSLPSVPNTLKIDEDTFLCDGKYSVTRVKEPTGIFYKCGLCEDLKKTLSQMRFHLRYKHIDGKKWVCEQCGKGFGWQSLLKQHMETHGTDKKYMCEACGKEFRTKHSLKGHKRVHLGKRYPCDKCDLVFKYSGGLAFHRKTAGHPVPEKVIPPEGETPFVPTPCPSCKREFVSLEKLQEHVTRCPVRGKVKRPCDLCGSMYLNLIVHKQKGCKGRLTQKKKEDSTDA